MRTTDECGSSEEDGLNWRQGSGYHFTMVWLWRCPVVNAAATKVETVTSKANDARWLLF